jgi:3-methyladenine DNA glycosylase AlkD
MSENRPTAKDLVEAVREFLETRVMPVMQGQTAFHARVAANVLAIVERELELGPVLDADEHERLRRLLEKEGTQAELNRELCLRIREGMMEYEDPALVEHLRRTTMGRLSIDNPRYAAYQRALSRER